MDRSLCLARKSAIADENSLLRDTPRRFAKVSAERNRSSGTEIAVFIPKYYRKNTLESTAHIAAAVQLIVEAGYHRRDRELADLQQAVGNKST
jgi:hypothetical protein